MHIVYILHSTGKYTGSSKSFFMLTHYMKYNEVTFSAVLPDKNGIYEDLCKNNIPVFTTPYRTNTLPPRKSVSDKLLFLPRLAGRLLVNMIAAIKIEQHLRKLPRVDIIHTNSSTVNVGERAAKKMGIPHIYHLREHLEVSNLHYIPTFNSFLKKLSQKGTYNICITKDIQKYYRQSEKPCSRVIYNGIYNKRSELPIATKKDYFLFAGRIEPNKGLDDLIKSFILFKKQSKANTKLYIIGESNDNIYHHEIKKTISDNDINDSIVEFGYREDIDIFMQHAIAIIVPSFFEGFGRLVAEAMFNGCIVIGRDCSGIKEQFDNGLKLENKEIALRFNTIRELFEAMNNIYSQPTEYSEYANRAFHTVNQLYSAESCAQNTFQFYKDIKEYSNQ